MRSIDDILKDHPEVKGFIISQDESGIYLLDFGDFPDKMESFEEVEKISALEGLRSLLHTRALSQEYLKKEWSNFNFERYLEREMQNIYDNEYRSSLNKIIKAIDEIANSDIPKSQKINKLLQYKESFSGPFIDDSDYSAKDVVSYAELKINILKLQESDLPKQNIRIQNQYPNIFTSNVAWKIFEELKSNFNSNSATEFSFIFLKMKNDKYIFENVTKQNFINWVNEIYDANIDRIYTEDRCFTSNRNTLYENLKRSIKADFNTIE